MESNGKMYISWKFLAGILLTAVFGFIGWELNTLHQKIGIIEHDHQGGFERLSALEAQRADFSFRLDRIELKLDRLIEGR